MSVKKKKKKEKRKVRGIRKAMEEGIGMQV